MNGRDDTTWARNAPTTIDAKAMPVIMTVVLALTFILASGLGTPLSASQSPTAVNATYEQFIALDADARRQQLDRMSAEVVTMLRRTHAERWFAAHGSRLSDAQVSVFNEVLAFISGDLYSRPANAAARKREEELTHKLTCVLGVDNTRQAFVLHMPHEEPRRPGLRQTVDAWVSWFFDCVVP